MRHNSRDDQGVQGSSKHRCPQCQNNATGSAHMPVRSALLKRMRRDNPGSASDMLRSRDIPPLGPNASEHLKEPAVRGRNRTYQWNYKALHSLDGMRGKLSTLQDMEAAASTIRDQKFGMTRAQLVASTSFSRSAETFSSFSSSTGFCS